MFDDLPAQGWETDRSNGARIYDYDLGGSHNTAADRKVAEQIRQVTPYGPWVARANRAFLHRAVRFCLDQGITQFLDLGSGIPTVGNVHEIAQYYEPTARVVYVDYEPVAVAHTRRLLQDQAGTDVVDADLRYPDQVLESEPVNRLLDLDKPVALLLVAALHYVADNPVAALRTYTAAVNSGSLLVASHCTSDGREAEAAEVQKIFGSDTSSPITLRSHDEIRRIIEEAGWRFVRPGLVRPPEWRPTGTDPDDGPLVQSGSWAGVALR